MAELFLQIVNMSLSATCLVLAVVILRLLLRKAPKWSNVLLWSLVAVRLVCPFTLESALSLIPSAEVIPPNIMLDAAPTITTGIPAVNSVINPVISETFAPEPAASANPLQIWIPVLSVIWCVGMALMLVYTFVSYGRLRYRVRMAIRVKDNIYLSEYVSSPFVLGIFQPRIFLPYHMDDTDRFHVIAHERAHIRRHDHWWKPLGFLLLTVHWFNPVMWIAYILLCRDIELACDERVIKELDAQQRADYSQALLHCSITHRSIAACPIAFGEVGVKARVKNVLSYKKPAFWMILVCLIVVLIVSVCFLTNPKEEHTPWTLQELKAADVDYIEFRDPSAPTDKQYTRYDGFALSEAVAMLNRFDGDAMSPASVSDYVGSGYEISIVMEDGAIHTIWNMGNKWLCIDGEYYDDSHNTLNSDWDYYFTGTEAVPENDIWGLSFSNVDVTPTMFWVKYDEDTRLESLVTDGNFTLQRLTGNQWQEVKKLPNPEDFSNNSIQYKGTTYVHWENIYGELPVGTYRLSYNFYLEHMPTTVFRTLSVEFTIADSIEDPGIAITAENISPTGLTIVYEPVGSFQSIDATTSLDYWLEVYDGNQWRILQPTQEIEPVLQERSNRIRTLIDSNDRHELDWSTTYGYLSAGTYRIGVEFSFHEFNIYAPIYAEFTMTPHWGIDLVMDELSESDLTVNFLLNNTDTDTKYYFTGSTLQVRDRNGYWTDIIPLPEDTGNRERILSNNSAMNLVWDAKLHALSEGQYRIGIRIARVLPSGEEEFYTFYEYFDPSTYAWGAALEVTGISCTDQDVSIEYRQTFTKTLPEGSLAESGMIGLQRRENNQWVDFERTYYVSDLSDAGRINLSAYFGHLPNGTYRLVRYITRRYEDGTTQTRPIYAVFAVDSNAEITAN